MKTTREPEHHPRIVQRDRCLAVLPKRLHRVRRSEGDIRPRAGRSFDCNALNRSILRYVPFTGLSLYLQRLREHQAK